MRANHSLRKFGRLYHDAVSRSSNLFTSDWAATSSALLCFAHAMACLQESHKMARPETRLRSAYNGYTPH